MNHQANRLGLVLAALSLLSTGVSQTAPQSQPDKTKKSDVLVLTPFEVTAGDTDRGLLSTNSVSATKNNTPIKDIPGNIYVLNEQYLAAQVPFDLNDMLRFAPGVNLDGDYRNETYQIRGFSGGLPLADGFTISRSFPTDQAAVERIEVLQGPAGILFGNVAGVGGIVNRIMKKPQFKPATAMNLSYKSGDSNVRFMYDTTNAVGTSKNLAYRLIVATQKNDGLMDHAKLDRFYVRPSLLWQISEQSKLTFEPDFTYVKQTIGYMYDYWDRSANGKIIAVPESSNPAGSYWRAVNRKYSMMTTFLHQFNADWFLRVASFTTINFLIDWDPRLGTALTSDNKSLPLAPGDSVYPKGFMQFQRRAVGNYYLQADVSGKVKLGDVTLHPIGGFEWKLDPNWATQKRTATGFGGIANAPINVFAPDDSFVTYPVSTDWQHYERQVNKTDAKSLYGNMQVDLLQSHLKIVGGYRFIKSRTSNVSERRQNAENVAAAAAGRAPLDKKTWGQSEWDNVKRAGLVYDVSRSLGAYASYAESYEARTSTDNLGRIYPPGLGKQKEVGFKTSFYEGRITSTISYYTLNQVNNILSYATGTTGPSGETTAAVGEVQAKGFEFNGIISVTDGLQLLPSYSHTKATTVTGGSLNSSGASSVANLEVSKYPKDVVKLFFSYRLPKALLEGFSLNGGVVYTSSVDEGLLRAIAPTSTTITTQTIVPSSTVINVGAVYQVNKHWRVSAKIDNVTDERYYIPSSSSNTRLLRGLPRAISLDASYKF